MVLARWLNSLVALDDVNRIDLRTVLESLYTGGNQEAAFRSALVGAWHLADRR